jgi:hypothetical protein
VTCKITLELFQNLYTSRDLRVMGSKNQEYKELFEKIDQEEDGEVYLR